VGAWAVVALRCDERRFCNKWMEHVKSGTGETTHFAAELPSAHQLEMPFLNPKCDVQNFLQEKETMMSRNSDGTRRFYSRVYIQ
jgi:hypothetical protein